MKRKVTWRFALLIALLLLIPGCTPAAAPAEEVAEPEAVEAGDLTFAADEAYQPAIEAIFAAFAPGETPTFTADDADIVITEDMATDAGSLRRRFLPDAVMVAMSDAPAAADLIAFAISPDGQQALIDAGFLPESITLTDQAGNTVEIAQPVRRVISSHGPTTFLVYGVGAGDRLVAASYLGARDVAGAAAMTAIDPRFEDIMGDDAFTQSEFSAEGAVALAPDLIMTSASTSWLDVAGELGFTTFLFKGESPEALKEAMLLSGQIFGPAATEQAEAWVAYYDEVLARVAEVTAGAGDDARPRVLFTGTEALRVASGEMLQSMMIVAAGAESVSAELTGGWNDVNIEQVATWNPDIILVPPYGGASVDAILDSEEWQILDAVAAGKVYRMPKLVAPWDTPSPDSVMGLIWMTNLFYPEAEAFDCADEVTSYYATFYQYDIPADQLAGLCGE